MPVISQERPVTLLLDNASGSVTGNPIHGRGSQSQIIVQAVSWNGGSVSLETSFDDVNWSPVDFYGNPAVFTSNYSFTAMPIASTATLRAVLNAGEGSPTGVSVYWSP